MLETVEYGCKIALSICMTGAICLVLLAAAALICKGIYEMATTK